MQHIQGWRYVGVPKLNEHICAECLGSAKQQESSRCNMRGDGKRVCFAELEPATDEKYFSLEEMELSTNPQWFRIRW